MLRAILVGGGLALAAAPAMAVPVTLDPTDIARTDPAGLTGVFPGTGFVFAAESFDAEPERPAIIGRVNDGQTGADEPVQRLTIRRADGGAFDLRSLSIPNAYLAIEGFYQGMTRGKGKPQSVSDDITLLVDIAQLTGTTASGATVASSFLPVAAELTSDFEFDLLDNFVFNDDPLFGPDAFGPGFENLVSLSFSVAGYTALEAACAPENLSRVDPRFARSGPCAKNPSAGPLRDVRIDVDSGFGPRNDSAFYQLEAIALEAHPAPIPVPASLPLLLSGLGALAFAARRAR